MKKTSIKITKKNGVVHTLLSFVVLLVMLARFLRGDYYSVFLCIMTLILFYIPVFAEKTFRMKLPTELQIIILLFVFAAEILGEIGSFYTRVPWWDTMLHTVNGFLMAAIGFALIDYLNNAPRFHINLSPIFVAFVAFCFSMTIGVLWEFFEFGMDTFTVTDMQKDRIITDFSSVALNPDGINDPVIVSGITNTLIQLEGGETVTVPGGYLDVGIIDTMKDLLVNLIGAVVFSVLGYFYILGRKRGLFAQRFIPQMKTAQEIEEEKQKSLAGKKK